MQLEITQIKQLSLILEALLFSAKEPLTIQKMKEALEEGSPSSTKQIRQALELLQIEYEQSRSFSIAQIADGFILQTKAQYAPYLEALHAKVRSAKLSQAALEVLSIIAFKQPVTRLAIEQIRGVDSTQVIQNLLDRELIEISGRLEAPGKPALYITTKVFLTSFGLKNLETLKELQEYSATALSDEKNSAIYK